MLWTVLSCTSFAGVLWLWGWVCFTEPIDTTVDRGLQSFCQIRDPFQPVWILTLRRLKFFKHLHCTPFWTSSQSRISCWLCHRSVFFLIFFSLLVVHPRFTLMLFQICTTWTCETNSEAFTGHIFPCNYNNVAFKLQNGCRSILKLGVGIFNHFTIRFCESRSDSKTILDLHFFPN